MIRSLAKRIGNLLTASLGPHVALDDADIALDSTRGSLQYVEPTADNVHAGAVDGKALGDQTPEACPPTGDDDDFPLDGEEVIDLEGDVRGATRAGICGRHHVFWDKRLFFLWRGCLLKHSGDGIDG